MKLTHFALAGLAVTLAAGLYLTLNADMDGRMEQLQVQSDRQMQDLQRSIKELKIQQAQAPTPAEQVKEAVAEDLKGTASAVKKAGDALVKNLQTEANTLGARPKGAGDIVNTAGTKAEEVGAAIKEKLQIEPPLVDNPGDQEAARIAREEQSVLNANGVGMDRVAIEAAVAANAVAEGKALNPVQSVIASTAAIARIKVSDNDGYVVLDAGMNVRLMKGDRFAVRRGTAIIARVTIGDTVEATESVADVDPNTLVTGMVLEPGDEIIKFDR